ncbi:Transmembrane 9 superfamily member 4 [Symbiodinium microadriaticum]|uniref:Transmembrane 9 superfamily member n=1 Tax=Symbiodinium microadriaticum TaxID=2951 RepID=A0A1Q9EEM4_SYMMI|nr:Transmembrane 9 superfamily member 4 [Symbiodinium microadriaticum]
MEVSSSGSADSYSEGSQVSESRPVLRLSIRPRAFHLGSLFFAALYPSPDVAPVLDRPHLPIFELFLGSSTVGSWLLLACDMRNWYAISVASRECQRCLAHHLQLQAIYPDVPSPAVKSWADAAVPVAEALVDMKVNKLTSVKTQLPYDYYTLPFCQPKSILSSAENLGEILEGDRIENSPYEIRMKKDVICQVLCKQTLTPEMRKKFQTMIKDEYLVNWIVDNLPAATRYARQGKGELTYINGFPVGVERAGKFYLHNHVRIHLKYHENPEKYEGYRIVGFEVEPFSMNQAVKEENGFLTASCEDWRWKSY